MSRWFGGRLPRPRLRAKVSQLLDVPESELWPAGRRLFSIARPTESGSTGRPQSRRSATTSSTNALSDRGGLEIAGAWYAS